ncbi:TraB family protein [Euphorbia peplus]|nr:TraB family protein [Euphorbia peplus]
MNRSTRLVTQLKSPELHRFFRFGSFHPQIIQSSPLRFSKFGSFATNSVKPPAMDPYKPESSEPPPVSDEFVHIENPNPSLSESIVDVAAELREDNSREVAVTGADDLPERRDLPEELSRSVVLLTCDSTAEGGSCDVYLVGTAHVSQESCKEVQAVLHFLKPEVVFLELCSSRVAVLSPQNLKVPTMGDMIESWKKKHNLFGILYSWFLAKVAEKLEVFPGSEFRVAFEEARSYGGKVILGDRPVQITLRRTWAKMPLWHKTKLVYSLLFQAVFLPSSENLNKMLKEMDDVDMLTLVIQEMSKEFPTLMETLVHERDQYMSSTLLKVAREHSSVVAVVGKGHLQGIKKHWKQPIELKEILEMPSQRAGVSALKLLTSLGVVVAGAAIISGIYLTCKK